MGAPNAPPPAAPWLPHLPTTTWVPLHCHSCSHTVGEAPYLMRIIGLFRPVMEVRVPRVDPREARLRCPSCGWINVFAPWTSTGGEPCQNAAADVK